MDSIKPHDLDSRLKLGAWKGELATNVILVEALSPVDGTAVQEKLEEYLESQGFKGTTGSMRMDGVEPRSMEMFTGSFIISDMNSSMTVGPVPKDLGEPKESDTSEVYHQNLVGIEGWGIDVVNRTFGRFDNFAIKWFKDGGAQTLNFSQLNDLLTNRQGTIDGLRYNI